MIARACNTSIHPAPEVTAAECVERSSGFHTKFISSPWSAAPVAVYRLGIAKEFDDEDACPRSASQDARRPFTWSRPRVHAPHRPRRANAHGQDRDRACLLRGPDWNHDRSDDSVWVVNRDKGTVTVFDADTGEVLTSAPVLVGLDEKSGTHDLVVSKRLRKAFIVNETEKTVSVRSASTLELIDTIPINDTRPHHIKLSPDGKTAYVGLFATNRIAVIDGRTHHVDYYTTSQGSQIPLPLAHAPRPRQMAASSSCRTKWATW